MAYGHHGAEAWLGGDYYTSWVAQTSLSTLTRPSRTRNYDHIRVPVDYEGELPEWACWASCNNCGNCDKYGVCNASDPVGDGPRCPSWKTGRDWIAKEEKSCETCGWNPGADREGACDCFDVTGIPHGCTSFDNRYTSWKPKPTKGVFSVGDRVRVKKPADGWVWDDGRVERARELYDYPKMRDGYVGKTITIKEPQNLTRSGWGIVAYSEDTPKLGWRIEWLEHE